MSWNEPTTTYINEQGESSTGGTGSGNNSGFSWDSVLTNADDIINSIGGLFGVGNGSSNNNNTFIPYAPPPKEAKENNNSTLIYAVLAFFVVLTLIFVFANKGGK